VQKVKCSKCDTEYNDSFKFCPNCAEANPLIKKEAPTVVPEPPGSPIAEPEQQPQPVVVKKEKPPRKKLYESIKPAFSRIKEKTNKKTIITGAGILVLIIAAIVVAVILTRPSYPATFKLGDLEQEDLSIKGLTLTKGEKAGDTTTYELTGTALGKWNGGATINLSMTTNKGPQTEKFELAIKRNDEQEIKNLTSQNRDSAVFVSNPIQKCEVQSISYDSKMNSDDFVSIDNVTSGLTLSTGANVIVGTVKEDGCTVTFNGQPVQIGPDKKFSVTATINEGSNPLNFEVAEKGGVKSTKTITLTGQIPPQVYKASCPAGPPFAVLNKNPDAYKGQLCQYRGKVVQAMESAGTTDIRMDVTPGSYGFWSDTVYVTLAGTTPAVTDSIVVVYGTIGGSYTYTSTANYKITLPLINAKYVDVQ
jgi:hypothetical protein